MVSASGTHHHRLTEGWRAFCLYAGVEIGDTVRFEQAGAAGILNARVERH